MGKLLKELDAQYDEVQHLFARADDNAEDPAEVLDARIYMHAVEDLREAVISASNSAKYLLSDIDAEGELILGSNGRFQLPKVGLYELFEFSCASSIELYDEKERRWMHGSVEYSDKYEHGYYFKQVGIGLQPGMKARHRHVNLWDD
jgi:hypothetical protein